VTVPHHRTDSAAIGGLAWLRDSTSEYLLKRPVRELDAAVDRAGVFE
jgi:hypothetical protein